MKTLTLSEIFIWCKTNNIAVSNNKLKINKNELFKFEIPSDAGQRVSKTKELFEKYRNENEILIWITDWGVWPSSERMHIFERFRKSYGINSILIEEPGQIYNKEEYEDALSLCILCTWFLWDCYIINSKANKFLFFSHDEYGLQNI